MKVVNNITVHGNDESAILSQMENTTNFYCKVIEILITQNYHLV